MSNITVLILGIMLSILPAGDKGGEREAAALIKSELGLQKVRVEASKPAFNGNAIRWETIKVTFGNWETDAGAAAGAIWLFQGIEAEKKSGFWLLANINKTEIVLSFDEDALWETAALTQARVQITGLWIQEDEVSLKGAYGGFLGVPVEFAVSGKPVLKDGTAIFLEGAGETKIFRFEVGNLSPKVRDFVLGSVNPIANLSDFDVISPYSEPYEKYVGIEFMLNMKNLDFENGQIMVSGNLGKSEKD